MGAARGGAGGLLAANCRLLRLVKAALSGDDVGELTVRLHRVRLVFGDTGLVLPVVAIELGLDFLHVQRLDSDGRD